MSGELSKNVVDGYDASRLFAQLGGKFAASLIERGYTYEEASRLLALLASAAFEATSETAYPDGVESFRNEKGLLPINDIPSVEIRLTHHFGEWGGNLMEVERGAREALDEIKPKTVGVQGELIVAPYQNHSYAGVAIPGGFYPEDGSDVAAVSDSNGATYGSYGELADAIGAWEWS